VVERWGVDGSGHPPTPPPPVRFIDAIPRTPSGKPLRRAVAEAAG
jgi:acyl-coenzyme A synthetase/AMP-(fatty) acid ligase